MLTNEFVVAMGLKGTTEKQSRDALKKWHATGDPKYLDEAEVAVESAQQFEFYGVRSLCHR